jgi:hypothetical protein
MSSTINAETTGPSSNCPRMISPREAIAYCPRLEEFCDAGEGPGHFISLRKQQPESIGNVLVTAPPGYGKTRLVEAHLREVFGNPLLHNGDLEEATEFDRLAKAQGIRVEQSAHDTRFWQTGTGRIYAYARIDGASDPPKLVERKVFDVLYNEGASHTFVFVDEAGELYFRGLEECLRPVLTAANITTYGTAQNFHSKKRRTDTVEEDRDRVRAFLRRFPKVVELQKPGDEPHLRFLARKCYEWCVRVDHPSTLRLLVTKSDGVVGQSLRLMIQAIDAPGRMLTREMVLADDVDPLGP